MKLDRLMGILTVLLQKESVTAPYLARRFEVSRRTISRDIDALCRAGIPVVTRQGKNGGISIADGFKLDKSVLSVDELSSIISALKGLGSVTQGSGTQRVLDKLAAGGDAVLSLRESVIIDLASHYKGSLTEKIELLKEAVRECRVIEFDYYYEKGECRRCIEPYFVVFKWTAWYVFGFCQNKQDWRMFKLTRLWNLKLYKQAYAPREIPPDKQNFSTQFSGNKQLVALFDASVQYLLIDSYGLDCCTKTRDGRLKLEVGYTNDEFMLSWLLGFGAKVTVLEPLFMAERIKEAAESILRNYL